jgi:sulfate adenylyltransferase (ADP) / ATP adenylyltransferase
MGETPELTEANLVFSRPGELWELATARTQEALACGALQPIQTDTEWIEQGGVRFLVRILANIGRKEAAAKKQNANPNGRTFNPFLPYDRDLFVADLSPTHVCLLNKYNVVDHHLLIITRAYEAQEDLLTLSDWEALWVCLHQIDGLGFYNSGKQAGASQPHKHLQLLPLPLVPQENLFGQKVPIEAAFTAAIWQDKIGISPVLPFQHAMMRLDWHKTLTPQQAAQNTLAAYSTLLTALGLKDGNEMNKLNPYNLLITREWLLIVPRMQEQFESISVNSLGFAGTLFVRNQEQFNQLKTISPFKLLSSVAVAKSVD